MRIFAFFAFPIMATGFRSLGEIAHPNKDFKTLWKFGRGIDSPFERAYYMALNGMEGAATIGFFAESERRSERFMRAAFLTEKLLAHPDNFDTPGRDLGIGLFPHPAYCDPVYSFVLNSSTLTMRDAMEAKAKAQALPFGGAWLYLPVLPRFTSEGREIVSAHVDNYFVPLNGDQPWWLTSLVNPTATGRQEVVDLLKTAGYDYFTPEPPASAIEKLFAGAPPDPQVGNWNFVMTGGFDEFGQKRTSGRLFATMLGVEDAPYEATLVPKIWLNNDQYKAICAIRFLEAISKSKDARYPLSLGIHTALNSCMHVSHTFYGAGDTYKCKPLNELYLEAIDRAFDIYHTQVPNKEMIDFFTIGDPDFQPVTKVQARDYINGLFSGPLLRNARPGRSAYRENYFTCGVPHPKFCAAKFYELAADTAIELLEHEVNNLYKV